jgi:hypothetical protein
MYMAQIQPFSLSVPMGAYPVNAMATEAATPQENSQEPDDTELLPENELLDFDAF